MCALSVRSPTPRSEKVHPTVQRRDKRQIDWIPREVRKNKGWGREKRWRWKISEGMGVWDVKVEWDEGDEEMNFRPLGCNSKLWDSVHAATAAELGHCTANPLYQSPGLNCSSTGFRVRFSGCVLVLPRLFQGFQWMTHRCIKISVHWNTSTRGRPTSYGRTLSLGLFSFDYYSLFACFSISPVSYLHSCCHIFTYSPLNDQRLRNNVVAWLSANLQCSRATL